MVNFFFFFNFYEFFFFFFKKALASMNQPQSGCLASKAYGRSEQVSIQHMIAFSLRYVHTWHKHTVEKKRERERVVEARLQNDC